MAAMAQSPPAGDGTAEPGKEPPKKRGRKGSQPTPSQQAKKIRIEVDNEDPLVLAQLLEDEDKVEGFQHFLLSRKRGELGKILAAEDPLQHHPLQIEMAELLEANPLLATLLYKAPRRTLPLLDTAIVKSQEALQEEDPFTYGQLAVKERAHARLHLEGSPFAAQNFHPEIGRLRFGHQGKLLLLHGTVIRAGAVQMLESQRLYECANCQHRFTVKAEVENNYQLQTPARCPSRGVRRCTSTKLEEVAGGGVACDWQEIRLQESLQSLGPGSIPRSIHVILLDDLADSVRAGDEVVVTGVLVYRWRSLRADSRCDLEPCIEANSIWCRSGRQQLAPLKPEEVGEFRQFWEAHVQCPLKGRDKILRSICPQVYGLAPVKLAVALMLTGGVQRVDESGTKVRGDCHLLLVGDPGTGKSQFLKYAAKLSARAVLTSGPGSSAAGLTATAVKDEGQWVLEAGALVLADGGLCCIDEFSRMRQADRAAIHEAMEQQTLSIAKAGLVATVNTRASVFAVTNPKGHYDPEQSLTVNTAIATPLLSRFDMVMVLRDRQSADWDRSVAAHILREHTLQGGDQKNLAPPPIGTPGGDLAILPKQEAAATWSIEKLQSYFWYIKRAFQPELTPDAEALLSAYYQRQRRAAAASDNAARTTLRMLESLIRLAQAHARLMCRNTVLRVDAVAALTCMEASTTSTPLLDTLGEAVQGDFPQDPDQEYVERERIILKKLGMPSPPSGTLRRNLPVGSGTLTLPCLPPAQAHVPASEPRHVAARCIVPTGGIPIGPQGIESSQAANQGQGQSPAGSSPLTSGRSLVSQVKSPGAPRQLAEMGCQSENKGAEASEPPGGTSAAGQVVRHPWLKACDWYTPPAIRQQVSVPDGSSRSRVLVPVSPSPTPTAAPAFQVADHNKLTQTARSEASAIPHSIEATGGCANGFPRVETAGTGSATEACPLLSPIAQGVALATSSGTELTGGSLPAGHEANGKSKAKETAPPALKGPEWSWLENEIDWDQW